MQVTFLKSSKALNNSRLERNRRTFITTCLTLSERHFWPQYFEPLWTQRLIFKSINDLFLERNKFCHSRISFVFKFSLQFRSMILNSKFINDIMFEMSSSCLYSYLRHCALKRYDQTPTVSRVPTHAPSGEFSRVDAYLKTVGYTVQTGRTGSGNFFKKSFVIAIEF